jgi:hypothetical protein
MSPIAIYLFHRTVRDLELDTQICKMIEKLRKRVTTHANAAMFMYAPDFDELTGNIRGKASLSDAGYIFYKESALLLGLWFYSLPEPPDDDKDIDVMDLIIGAMTSFLEHGQRTYYMIGAHYINKWLLSGDAESVKERLADIIGDSANAKELKKQLTSKDKAIRKLQQQVQTLESTVSNRDKKLADATAQAKQALARANDADVQLRQLRAKLSEAETRLASDERVGEYEKKITTLERELAAMQGIVDDVNRLALVGEEDEPLEPTLADTLVERDWSEQAALFTGRLVLHGGHPNWQEKVSEWFENNGIKVKALTPGDDLGGIRPSDTVLLHTSGNKHKYSVPCINKARRIGARLILISEIQLDAAIREVLGGGEVNAQS